MKSEADILKAIAVIQADSRLKASTMDRCNIIQTIIQATLEGHLQALYWVISESHAISEENQDARP